MLRKISITAVIFLLGAVSGSALFHFLLAEYPRESDSQAQSGSNQELLDKAYEIAGSIKTGDYEALANEISPDKGLTFAPYSTILPNTSRIFTKSEAGAFSSDSKTYVWGESPGTGEPISLTVRDYFARYVYNKDYLTARNIGIDTVVKAGNSLENMFEVFPGARSVEFHFPGFDPQMEGIDWCSLRLVFENQDGKLYLVAIIHSEWTI